MVWIFAKCRKIIQTFNRYGLPVSYQRKEVAVSPFNDHICKFLSYYCSLKNAPGYAVLITGKWGTGKTWFIQDCLKKIQENEQHYLYVSLYGMTSFEDIENEFFRQLNPLLASKTAKLLGKMGNDLLKEYIKLDLSGKDLIKNKIDKQLKSCEDRTLIFDDIERSSISIVKLLGYINQFVEHSGFKVILIANEEEITSNKKCADYSRIKEKIVRKTFEITPEIEPALNHFANQLQYQKTKTIINENKELVTQIFKYSGYKNLRILKHTLWDFDHLISNLSNKITDQKEIVSHLLSLYLIYSFEIMSGEIKFEEIPKLQINPFLSTGKKNNQEDQEQQKFRNIVNKYIGIDFRDTLFETSIWQSIFSKGIHEINKIEEAIFKSVYFQSENVPNWVKLWNGMGLSDSDFESMLKIVEKEWQDKKYTEIGILKHVVGILLWLSDIELYRHTKDEILSSSKEYVDYLKSNGFLLNGNYSKRLSPFENESWGGLGFFSRDDEKFKEFIKYLDVKINEATIEKFESEAPKLLQLMKDDTGKFVRHLTLTNHEDNKFYNFPILNYIDSEEFVKTLLSLPPAQMREVGYIFKERYKFTELNQNILSEFEFLNSIMEILRKEKNNRIGKMSGYTIGLFINQNLEKALEKLKSDSAER